MSSAASGVVDRGAPAFRARPAGVTRSASTSLSSAGESIVFRGRGSRVRVAPGRPVSGERTGQASRARFENGACQKAWASTAPALRQSRGKRTGAMPAAVGSGVGEQSLWIRATAFRHGGSTGQARRDGLEDRSTTHAVGEHVLGPPPILASVSKWTKGLRCKRSGFGLRKFESIPDAPVRVTRLA